MKFVQFYSKYFIYSIVYTHICVCVSICEYIVYIWNIYYGSSGHEISQVRILLWATIHFSRGSSWLRDRSAGEAALLATV